MRIEDKKITELREAKGISRMDLANAMFSDVGKVYKVEQGKAGYSDAQLKHLKAFFDVEDMPLTEFECDVCKKRLYVMRDYIRDRWMDNAKSLLDQYAKLVNLEPCDKELPMLYRVFEVLYLFNVNQDAVAEEKLNYLGTRLQDMNNEHLFYYYYGMITLSARQVRYEDAMAYCNKARRIVDEDKNFDPVESGRLHAWIATCYSMMDYPGHALHYVHKTQELYSTSRSDRLDLYLDCALAFACIQMNILEEAEKLLNACLVRAKAIGDDYHIGMVLRNFGLLHKKATKWDIAIQYLDQALEYLDIGYEFYLFTFYQKINCLIESRAFPKAHKAIEQALKLYGTDKVFGTHFESRKHFLTISRRITMSNEEAVKYLVTVAIPYFIKVYDYIEAADCYKLLELHYKKTNSVMKSMQMGLEARKIYERCFTGCEEV